MREEFPTDGIDRQHLRDRWVLPGAGALVAMALGFVVVAVVLFVRETVILASLWTRGIALSVMFLLPHVVAGAWVGARHGIAVEPPLAASLAPVSLLVVVLVLFGGPVLTPFRAPAVLFVALVVWILTFTLGMVAGARLTRLR